MARANIFYRANIKIINYRVKTSEESFGEKSVVGTMATMAISGSTAMLETGTRLSWLKHQLKVLFPKYRPVPSSLRVLDWISYRLAIRHGD
jgi:hypothetical protein